MSLGVALLAFVSIALAACAQTLLKMGVSAPAVKAAMLEDFGIATVQALVTSPLVMGGLACFGLSTVLWLSVLARVPLSLAYPAVALGIVFTVLSGRFLLGESISAGQCIGIALIVAGVVVLTLSRLDQAQ